MELRGRSLYSGDPDVYQCIFIHIPKNAGTSVAQALFGRGSRHVPCIEYEKANPRKFRRYFKFAFVRNPWDRLYSAYHFLRKGGMSSQDSAWANAHLGQFQSFEEFVHEWVNQDNVMSWVHFMHQHHFIIGSNGQMAMDYLGRMENIKADFDFVSRKLGISVPLSALNKTEKDPYVKAYTSEMIEIVGRVYRQDVSMLGYTFGGER
jgi:hypothetical protein